MRKCACNSVDWHYKHVNSRTLTHITSQSSPHLGSVSVVHSDSIISVVHSDSISVESSQCTRGVDGHNCNRFDALSVDNSIQLIWIATSTYLDCTLVVTALTYYHTYATIRHNAQTNRYILTPVSASPSSSYTLAVIVAFELGYIAARTVAPPRFAFLAAPDCASLRAFTSRMELARYRSVSWPHPFRAL